MAGNFGLWTRDPWQTFSIIQESEKANIIPENETPLTSKLRKFHTLTFFSTFLKFACKQGQVLYVMFLHAHIHL